ncbi:unnamed protein product, partial [Staurois parvus]
MKIRAATPPTQRNADPRVGAISSNGTPPALKNTTVLGAEVPMWAAFLEEVQGLLPCVARPHLYAYSGWVVSRGGLTIWKL